MRPYRGLYHASFQITLTSSYLYLQLKMDFHPKHVLRMIENCVFLSPSVISQDFNRPLYTCVFGDDLGLYVAARLEATLLCYRPLRFFSYKCAQLALKQLDLHNKSSDVCIKTRSPPASLPYKGQVTEQATVKWPIQSNSTFKRCFVGRNSQVEFPLLLIDLRLDFFCFFFFLNSGSTLQV